MGQSKANQWIHVLLPALLAALRALGDAPARSLTALAQRLGVSEADAATVVIPLEEEPAPVAPVPPPAPTSPLLPMTAPNGGSSALKTLLNRRTVIPTVCPSHDPANMLLYQELLTSIQVWRGHGQEAKRGEAGEQRITRHVKRLSGFSSRLRPPGYPNSRSGT